MIEVKNFLSIIEEMVVKSEITYLDAILECADKYGVEIEFLAALVKKDKVMKQKLEVEAGRLNCLKEKK